MQKGRKVTASKEDRRGRDHQFQTQGICSPAIQDVLKAHTNLPVTIVWAPSAKGLLALLRLEGVATEWPEAARRTAILPPLPSPPPTKAKLRATTTTQPRARGPSMHQQVASAMACHCARPTGVPCLTSSPDEISPASYKTSPIFPDISSPRTYGPSRATHS